MGTNISVTGQRGPVRRSGGDAAHAPLFENGEVSPRGGGGGVDLKKG